MSLAELETVRALAQLARLALSPEEEARLAPELGRILAAFEVLQRPLPPGAPASGEHAAPTLLRGDQPLPSLERSALLASAPESEEGFLRVPKTVGGDG
jgi:aspartyl-tRNA(Asn)/glutamyl-tRNA(Gln) amidotransferase subunit C